MRIVFFLFLLFFTGIRIVGQSNTSDANAWITNGTVNSVVYSNDKNYLLVLTPVKKNLRDFFDNISVYLDAKNCAVMKIDLVEPSGDNTVITFTDQEINVPIADAEFSTN